MVGKGVWRKLLWPTILVILLMGVRKTRHKLSQESQCLGQDSELVPPEYISAKFWYFEMNDRDDHLIQPVLPIISKYKILDVM